MNQTQTLNDTLQALITDEMMKAMGLNLNHWSRAGIHAIVKSGTRHFADICVQLDSDIAEHGFSQAVHSFVPNFAAGCYHHGTNHIPASGPLLITSNHPGAADILTILALLNRDDVKIVLSGVPVVSALPNAQKHFIHVKQDTNARSLAIRNIINHLENTGTVFIFPTGHVTPDPDITPDASLVFEDWSESIALILRKVPEANLLMTVVSGVIEQRFLNSPLCKLRKVKWRQQILAEFMQITSQMMHPAKTAVTPRVTFMAPVTGNTLSHIAVEEGIPTRMQLHSTILDQAREGFKAHIDARNIALYSKFS